jgi:hypothetical protein
MGVWDDEEALASDNIREVVVSDRQVPASEPSDSLIVGPTGDPTLQNQVFQALDGISLKHFEVFAEDAIFEIFSSFNIHGQSLKP